MGCKSLQLQDYFQLIDGSVRRTANVALQANGSAGNIRRALVNKYDEFDRIVRSIESVFEKDKAQSAVKRTYAYSPYGKRTRLTVTTYGLKGGKMVKQDVIKTKWEFNKFGQLAKIEKGNDLVEYLYDRHGRVLKRTANAMDTYYTYTPLGQLETKSLGAPYGDEKKTAIATLKYVYATDGTINARIVNGVKQSYQYDQMGQLLAVVNAAGAKVEQYSYDNAGNILKKDIGGKVTTYTYDKANQLVSSTCGGKTTNYEYDAAGRLVKEDAKSYAYGWLDKVMNITVNGKVTNSYSYSMNGQIASSTEVGTALDKSVQTSYIWDGLALLKRGTTEYVNEPAVTGGNPILSNGNALFNDMLGTTLGKYDGKKFIDNQSTSFGSGAKEGFFTGKPHVAGLGYAFLFRNYRSELGKWQSADPVGYPVGWNNLAYVNNHVTRYVDWLGATPIAVVQVRTRDVLGTNYQHTSLHVVVNTEQYLLLPPSVQVNLNYDSQTGNYDAHMSAYPSTYPIPLGYLDASYNHEDDNAEDTTFAANVTSSLSDTAFITSIFTTAQTYMQNEENIAYDVDPDAGEFNEGNSNSFIANLITNSGGTATGLDGNPFTPTNTPGWTHIITPNVFE